MPYMLVRNRVKDFDKWIHVFKTHPHSISHPDYGLHLINMWRDVSDPNNVFFMFEVESIERANVFLQEGGGTDAGELAGVIDGELHYIESVEL